MRPLKKAKEIRIISEEQRYTNDDRQQIAEIDNLSLCSEK